MLFFITIAACLFVPTAQTAVEVSYDADVTSLLQASIVHNDRSDRSRGEQIPLQINQNSMMAQYLPNQVNQGNQGNQVQQVNQIPQVMIPKPVQFTAPEETDKATKATNETKMTKEEKESHWNGICDVTFKDKQDCSKFGKADQYKLLSTWNWQERICKIRVPPIYGTYADACLWQGCLVNKNMEQAAKWYMEFKLPKRETPYCFKEHCGNTQFNLVNTTVDHAHQYCDQKFGNKWRELTAGPHGMGWDNEGPGSGLWECAHHNYHCDWSFCKLYVCDEPELREKFCTKENPCAPYHSAR